MGLHNTPRPCHRLYDFTMDVVNLLLFADEYDVQPASQLLAL